MKKFRERKFKLPIKSVTLDGVETGDFHTMGDIMAHFPWQKIQMESDIKFHDPEPSSKKKGEQDFRDWCTLPTNQNRHGVFFKEGQVITSKNSHWIFFVLSSQGRKFFIGRIGRRFRCFFQMCRWSTGGILGTWCCPRVSQWRCSIARWIWRPGCRSRTVNQWAWQLTLPSPTFWGNLWLLGSFCTGVWGNTFLKMVLKKMLKIWFYEKIKPLIFDDFLIKFHHFC